MPRVDEKPAASDNTAGVRTLREFGVTTVRAFLVGQIRSSGWNILKTAEEIDTPRSNIYKKLR